MSPKSLFARVETIMIMYILYDKGEIAYVLYDLETAIKEAMRLSLVLVRVRVGENGTARSMTIYDGGLPYEP